MQIIRNALRLKRKEFVTPHLVRITLEGDGVQEYKDCTLGNNNKIFIPPAGVKEVHFKVYNEQTEEWYIPGPELLPVVRTYTHRAIDLDKNEMVIDFVNHGENGPASRWANQAEVGYELGVAMKAQTKQIYPEADWYLLVGDATAIPVLSCILESFPATAKGVCVIEVHGEADEIKIETKGDFEFIWVHNSDPVSGSELADKVREIQIPEGNKFGYIATEFRSVKAIREYLRNEKGWKKDEFYAYSYWKAGVAEDASAKDRKEEKES